MLVAVPAAWAFAMYSFPGKSFVYGIYHTDDTPVSGADDAGLLCIKPAASVRYPSGGHSAGDFFYVSGIYHDTVFSSIPLSLLEAARLDGAGEGAVFIRIGIPMGFPGIMSAGILGFLESWNAIEAPMAFLKNRTPWPLSSIFRILRRIRSA